MELLPAPCEDRHVAARHAVYLHARELNPMRWTRHTRDWTPNWLYRFRMLQGPIGKKVQKCAMVFCQQVECEIVEMSIQVGHVHLLVKVPPKLSIPELTGVSSF